MIESACGEQNWRGLRRSGERQFGIWRVTTTYDLKALCSSFTRSESRNRPVPRVLVSVPMFRRHCDANIERATLSLHGDDGPGVDLIAPFFQQDQSFIYMDWSGYLTSDHKRLVIKRLLTLYTTSKSGIHPSLQEPLDLDCFTSKFFETLHLRGPVHFPCNLKNGFEIRLPVAEIWSVTLRVFMTTRNHFSSYDFYRASANSIFWI